MEPILKRSFFLSCLALFLVAILCADATERLVPVVVSKLPHDLKAFTQGLAIENDQLFESTGLYGQSSLRRLDLVTGEILDKKNLPSQIFAEGIAVFPSHIFQITWQEKQALLYDRVSLKLLKTFSYSGEGWGLCRDGETLWMSNGSSQLTQRDSQTFKVIRTLQVHRGAHSLEALNDIESVGPNLYANVWQTNIIVRIDKATGEVNGIVDASHLLSQQEKKWLSRDHVLNGIAYRPKTGTFFLTGKGWPWIFEVQLK